MKSVFKKLVLFTVCFSLAVVLFAEPKSTGITVVFFVILLKIEGQ